MDFFTYSNTSTNLATAQAFSGWESALWVERYRKSGEFEIKAKLSSGLRDVLPLGSFVSKVDTFEVMVVENHEIEDEADEDSELIISGRSMETILETRINTSNGPFPNTRSISSGNLIWGELTDQVYTGRPEEAAVTVINDHILSALTLLPQDDLQNLLAVVKTGWTSLAESASRTLKLADLYRTVIQLLEIGDLGIRVVRKHGFVPAFPYVPSPSVNTYFVIHGGEDVSEKIIFSVDAGDIERATYFWSNKSLKNVALIVGQYIYGVYTPPTGNPSGVNRRYMIVDGNDLDRDYIPGGNNDVITSAMLLRAKQELEAQRELTLSSVDISKDHRYQYRVDFDIGDIVSVIGNYGVGQKMRVVEFAEIEDESGYSRYPTLAAIEGA